MGEVLNILLFQRYNNDVARAADFIFSGNCISDDEEEEVSKVRTREEVKQRSFIKSTS